MTAHVRYLVAGLSEGRVTLCAICTMHTEMMSVSFLVEHQNQGRWFVSDLTSKQVKRFFLFGLKTSSDGFL
jgi:hypothetical protein